MTACVPINTGTPIYKYVFIVSQIVKPRLTTNIKELGRSLAGAMGVDLDNPVMVEIRAEWGVAAPSNVAPFHRKLTSRATPDISNEATKSSPTYLRRLITGNL